MKSEIVITELAGQKRAIRLRGAGLPKQGSAAWGGKQRVVTTWYPGNGAQATQQVLGPVENQTVFSGVWNTTRMIHTPSQYEPKPGLFFPISFADGLREIMEEIIRGGTLLRVLWINAEAATFGGRSIQRLGRAIDWTFTYARMDDIEWTITFDWTSRGFGQQKVTKFREDGTNATNISSLRAVVASVDDAVNNTKIQLSKRTIPKSANKFTLEQLGQILDAPGKLMKDFSQSLNRISNRIKVLGDLVNKAKGLPFEIEGQIADAALTMVQASNHFADAITRTPPEKYDAQQKLNSLTRAACATKGAIDSAHTVAHTSYPIAASIQVGLTARRATMSGKGSPPKSATASMNGTKTSVQTYLVHTGDTLMGISQKFYGNVEGAYGIAFANGLSLKTVTPKVGKVLIIPTMNAGPSGSTSLPLQSSAGQVVLPNGQGQQPGSI